MAHEVNTTMGGSTRCNKLRLIPILAPMLSLREMSAMFERKVCIHLKADVRLLAIGCYFLTVSAFLGINACFARTFSAVG
jgi:hypothetical protein